MPFRAFRTLSVAARTPLILLSVCALPMTLALAGPSEPAGRPVTPPASKEAGSASKPVATPPAGAAPAAKPPSPGPSPTGLITIESDSQKADNRTGIVTAAGNVRITDPDRGLVATARQAQYFSKEGRLVLSGDVDVIDAKGQRIRAERLVYRLDDDRLVAEPSAGRQVFSRLRLQNPPAAAPAPIVP